MSELKLCQGTKCHTYYTKDRVKGTKENKTNQTRRRSNFYYGGGNFCSLNCQNDWWAEYGTRVIDYIGRIKAPMILTAENGWRRVWNRVHWDDNTAPRYIERNMITQEERPCDQG